MSKDPIILNYEESLLRKSDVDLLLGPHWLNDNVISFYFEYLKSTFHKAPYLLFVTPEVTQCIKIIPSAQMDVFLDPLNAKTKRFIFFAFNDNEVPQTAGGTHWSLLVYSRDDQTMFHYDSSGGLNSHQAGSFARKLLSYFNVDCKYREELSLQQSNGYDCGIFLICNAEFLARYIVKEGTCEGFCSSEYLRDSVGNMRNQIINIIEGLRS